MKPLGILCAGAGVELLGLGLDITVIALVAKLLGLGLDITVIALVAMFVAVAVWEGGERRGRDRHGLDGLQRMPARARIIRPTPAMISPRRRP